MIKVMNRKIQNLLLAISFVALLGVVSCDENSDPIDTTAPSIEMGDPLSGESFEAGNSVHFEASFSDDIELGAYKIDIHNNFDGHSHGRVAGTNEDPDLLKWSLSESFDFDPGLRNSDVHLHDELEIPQNTMAGPYHFIVSAVDRSGNSTSYQDNSTKEVEIYITNDSQPVVNITNLEGDELEIEVGEVFMVKGDVTDQTTGEHEGMHGMDIILGEGHDHDHDHDHDHGGRIASEEDLIELELEEEELEKYMTDGAIALDMVFEDINFVLSQEQLDELLEEEIDHLMLMIKVHDEQGNIAVSNTEVHVHMD